MVDFEAEFEVLIVKYTYVGLGIILEHFDDSGGVDEVFVEEGREVSGRCQDFPRLCELVQ